MSSRLVNLAAHRSHCQTNNVNEKITVCLSISFSPFHDLATEPILKICGKELVRTHYEDFLLDPE